MDRKRAVFIVNPKAGTKSKAFVLDLIKSYRSPLIDHEIFYWEHQNQGPEIATYILKGGFNIAVAVGGDGTVNEIAKTLVDTDISLGIIPCGSGNGLARHLGIPLNASKALSLLEHGTEATIDSCMINEKAFFCTAGFGFDAHIGKLFAESSSRGFSTYTKITLSEFSKYKPEEYQITINGKQIVRKAFLIAVANAAQYGNNAYIAPLADIRDGLMDISIIKPFKTWNMPGIGLALFRKTLNLSPFCESFRAASLSIKRLNPGPLHYDGEPWEAGTEINISIKPASLRVIVPLRSRG
jgi:diacylglycerol kinase (ATP)